MPKRHLNDTDRQFENRYMHLSGGVLHRLKANQERRIRSETQKACPNASVLRQHQKLLDDINEEIQRRRNLTRH